MTKQDGGPAFPFSTHISGNYVPGMSLRDWFAGQVASSSRALPADELARYAYEVADAMLAERRKP